MEKTIIVDWRSKQSIVSAERRKTRLENSGYKLIRTVAGFMRTTFTYKGQR